ncbi:hypothetical protein [Gemmata sp.]|uniref:hypothetical protein n=1 Tax=Gemmata sp. TaxID=1914242 RepID=UPI003F70AEAF
MTPPTDSKPHVEVRFTPAADKPGRFIVTAVYGGGDLHRDTIDLNSARSRAAFAKATRARLSVVSPDLDAGTLDAEASSVGRHLLSAAAAPPGAPGRGAPLAEVDVGRVARPELFHTPEVSGLTLAVMTDDGGRIVPRWRTYLRWADGRREVVDTPPALALAGGGKMFFGPDPGEPTAGPSPPWSFKSRSAWEAMAPPPDPAAAFKRVCRRFAEFLELGGDAERARGSTATLALWVVLTYAYPAWDAVPYLSVGGPAGSGKSRLLDILARVAFRPLSSSNLTAPALFRTIHAEGGTVLYDEAERLRQANDPGVQEVNSIFLAGYKRGGTAIRLEPVGDGFRPVRFAVYGPKVLACIAGLPPTLASRCIPFTMFRADKGSERPKRRLDADPGEWAAARDELHALALEHGRTWVALADRRDVVPDTISGRNYELWQPLLALAAWFQERGVKSLLDVVQAFAKGSVEESRDDAIPDADETVLEVLAEKVRLGLRPTPAEALAACRERDEATFNKWQPNTVSRKLKSYGIPTKKSNGERRYDVCRRALEEIEARYGIDLGFAESEPHASQRAAASPGERRKALAWIRRMLASGRPVNHAALRSQAAGEGIDFETVIEIAPEAGVVEGDGVWSIPQRTGVTWAGD